MTLYYDSGCTTPKSAATANTAFATPGIEVTGNVNANGATTIYAKAVDTAGNASSCENLVTYTHDGTGPTVTNITSTAANMTYKVDAGQSIPITVTFSEAVTVTGNPTLTLETGSTDAVVTYTSGSGSTTLTFTYTVFAGDNSTDLDYVSTSALGMVEQLRMLSVTMRH